MQPPIVRAATIVLVDGSAEYCATFGRAFRSVQPGTAFFPHTTGQAACEYLALCGVRYPVPDLVLVNRTLPDGEDGYMVLRAARALEKLAGLPVLLMGSDDEPGSTEAALAAGAAAYLVKPPEQTSYPQLVRDVLGWWAAREDEKMLHSFCATLTTGSSSGELVSVRSSPAMTLPAFPIPAFPAPVGTHENPMAEIARQLGDFLGYLKGGNVPSTSGLFVERKLMEITIACREVGISERHARGKIQDPEIVRKRGRVIKRLMAMEWANTELLEYFEVRRTTMFKLRAEYAKEVQRSCMVVGLPRQ